MQLIAPNKTQTANRSNLNTYNNRSNAVPKQFKDTFYEKYHAAKTHIYKTKAHSYRKTKPADKVNLLALGKISRENPTVSDVLFKHPIYGKNCWKIIHSQPNKGKPFNNIQTGTQVYINSRTFEISWNSSQKTDGTVLRQHLSSDFDNIGTRFNIKNGHNKMQFVGRISDENPTVSSLLVKHPDYEKKCWKIIQTAENSKKPFDKIKPGTAIYINSKNFEITWKAKKNHIDRAAFSKSLPYTPPIERLSSKSHALSSQLESSVRSYMGKPYSDLNCYELVIRGLRHVGIQYSGKNGLKEKLVQMALNKGLPPNSYLTGEGIIETTSNKVFSKSFQHITDPKKTARALIKELAPFLDNGLILSFSTPTRGHMGIVSNNNELWTFINSGTMDNQFDAREITKGVGEEALASEIYNWLRLAAKRNEALQITLGKVSDQRMAAENVTFFKKLG